MSVLVSVDDKFLGGLDVRDQLRSEAKVKNNILLSILSNFWFFRKLFLGYTRWEFELVYLQVTDLSPLFCLVYILFVFFLKVLFLGDSEKVALPIAKELGIDEVPPERS